MEEKGIMVCSPTTSPPGVPSVVRHCHRCAAQVWVSATLLPQVEKRDLDLTCLDCSIGFITAPGSHGTLLPEQVPELRARGILGFSRELIDRLNNREPTRTRGGAPGGRRQRRQGRNNGGCTR